MPDLAMLDYFYGDEAEQFTFYRIPKVLFTDPSYRRISSDAKILYGLMLDRMGLSVRNGWLDEYNRVFIFFTLEDALEYLCCGHTKAVSLFGELDTQQIITIALCVLGTQLTRFVPFLIFNEHRKTPAFVQYLGKVLPGAIFSMLVVYCLRSVSFRRYSYGLPELIGIFITAGLHLWKRNILLSIAAGTITYMLLIRYVFV